MSALYPDHDGHDPIPDCDCHPCAIHARNALRAELAFARHEADLFKSDATTFRAELASVKANCKIIYWPKDGNYPIEHTMAANKDCYEMILAQMERDRAARPKDAP